MVAVLRRLSTSLGLGAMLDVIRELGLDLIEGRRRLDALIFDLDDVPAELGVNRIGNLPLSSLNAASANSGTIWSLVK